MANTQAMCTSFMQELMTGTHNFTTGTGNTFKAALFFSSATINAATTAYSTTGEVTGTNYTAGGVAVTNGTSPASPTLQLLLALRTGHPAQVCHTQT